MCYHLLFMRALFAALLLCLWLGAAWAEKTDEQEKLQVIKKEIIESREKLRQTRQQQQQVLGKLVGITKELKRAGQKLTLAKEKIKINESRIGQLTVELRRSEDDLQEKSSILERRVREAYKSGRVNFLELLFASRSMSDFLSRWYFFEKVIAQDAGLIQDIKAGLQETQTKRKVLSNRTMEIKELAQVIAEQKVKIAEQATEKKKVLEELKEREEDYREKIAELEKSSRELEVLIQKKMAERTRAGLVAHGSGVLCWPLQGRLTSRYGAYRRWGGGYRHTGIDIAAPYGSPIIAADSGEVIFSGWWDGYGKALVVDHGKGRATVYAHLSRIYVSAGAVVAKRQTIGLVGSTGYSTGPHLHFEVRKNGVPLNPMPYLPKN